MKIKINENICATSWHLTKGEIVDAALYSDSQRWIAAGFASVVEEDLETAALLPAVETSTIKARKLKK